MAANYAQIEMGTALELFLENVSLIGGADTTQTGEKGAMIQERDAVTLITLHASKGLEYPVVFIVGLEEGSLPHAHAIDKPERVEEERRLAYVGFTRAMHRLYLVHAMHRHSFSGQHQDTEPSRFLNDVPADLIVPHQMGGLAIAGSQHTSKVGGVLWVPGIIPDTQHDHASRRRKEEVRSSKLTPFPPVLFHEKGTLAGHPRQAVTLPVASQLLSSPAPSSAHRLPFKAGIKVRHARFGEGIVQKCEVVSGTTFVDVQFRATIGKKRLSMDFERLERV
jgi:DNA helicase-2/ATP-dependent DNA helicase PcrA